MCQNTNMRIAINGFGRIGRLTLRKLINLKDIEVVAINDLASVEVLAHLYKYDSVHGISPDEVIPLKGAIKISGKEIKILSEKEPVYLPWKDLKVDVVIECTGLFRREEDAEKHIQAGAKKVIISAPSKGGIKEVKTIVLGVNDEILNGSSTIISNASCTTNCLAPVVKVLDDNFGFDKGYLTTVHSYTSDQSIHDKAHRDLRRARAAAQNIIPTTTGAADALGIVMPKMKGKIEAMAMRVPVIDGSNIELDCLLNKSVRVEDVNKAFKLAAKEQLTGILEYSEAPLVSTDIIGNSHSSIFDSLLTKTMGNFVRVVSWYDNEAGFSQRLVDLILKLKRL